MSEPFMGEIRLFSFAFAPKNWAMCNGQLLPINQNQALFSLLGTTYGGNGVTTFALPDLRGRTPISFGAGFTLGERAGEEVHTLTVPEMPPHTHLVYALATDADGAIPSPTAALASFNNGYRPGGDITVLHSSTLSSVGGSQPHENRQPYAVLNFCMALGGIFPSPN
ncbi:phage tail protein [Sphingomonas sp.]|uniref:phage tail protein n=1 Tax=Sphingomonas sp. TaxID=28214 RepID=UPI002C09F8CB|nr:tail fiber protein [Sphingomonas sp.]HWK34794.1 tail fiber protein [Sphingomonas sp.]